MCENALAKRIFSTILSKSPNLDKTASMGVFEILIQGHFWVNQASFFCTRIECISRMVRSMGPAPPPSCFSRRPHHCVSRRILLRDRALTKKFYIRLKWAKLPLQSQGSFLPNLDETMARRVFKVIKIEYFKIIGDSSIELARLFRFAESTLITVLGSHLLCNQHCLLSKQHKDTSRSVQQFHHLH